MKNKKTQYTATTPNGQVLTVTSARPIVECHVAVNKETGLPGFYRWTTKAGLKPSAASCGASGPGFDLAFTLQYTYMVLPAKAM